MEPRFIAQGNYVLYGLSVCAVNVFVLISGYFMCVQELKLSRVVMVVLQVLFYTWIVAIVMTACGKMKMFSEEMIKSFLPFSYGKMWFAGAYVGLCLMSPLINSAIKSMNQKQHRNCLLILLFMSVFWSDLIPGAHPFGINKGYSVMWFICLYFLAAYIRIYGVAEKISKGKALRLYLGSTVIIWLSVLGMSYVLPRIPIVRNYISPTYYCRYNSIFVVVQSCALFLFFVRWNMKNQVARRIIKVISPLTFGVYLIHDGSIRFLMWDYMVRLVGGINIDMMLPLKSLEMVIIVFSGCLIIDYIRSIIFKFFNSRICVKKLYAKIDSLLF